MSWRRGDLVDMWSDGGRTAVFVHDTVVVLSEVASAILAAVPEDRTVTLAEIVEGTIAAVGAPAPPADPETIIRHQVGELVARNVLTSAVGTA